MTAQSAIAAQGRIEKAAKDSGTIPETSRVPERDAFGFPFEYSSGSREANGPFFLISRGPDLMRRTADDMVFEFAVGAPGIHAVHPGPLADQPPAR
jgi:hypothetical protein